MIYRNIFFDKDIPKFNPSGELIKYTGNIYTNARNLHGFMQLYDSKKDLYVACSKCASKKYSGTLKIKK